MGEETMKSTIRVIVLGVLALGLTAVAGCSQTQSHDSDAQQPNLSVDATLVAQPSVPALSKPPNNSFDITDDEFIGTDLPGTHIANAADIAAGTVVGTVSHDPSLKDPYAQVGELLQAPSVDAVITGTVTAVEYRDIDSIAYTALTVKVDKVLSGEVADTITVWETGGYVSASVVDAQNADKFPDIDLPDRAVSDYVDFQFMGADHPTPGDRLLLPLLAAPGFSGADGLAYFPVGDVTGRFTINEAASMVTRAAADPGWETTASKTALAPLLGVGDSFLSDTTK
jgi:hypothetical protein